MHLMKKFTERLNLYVCPKTYNTIKQVATQEGRKTGSMARSILQRWAKEQERTQQP